MFWFTGSDADIWLCIVPCTVPPDVLSGKIMSCSFVCSSEIVSTRGCCMLSDGPVLACGASCMPFDNIFGTSKKIATITIDGSPKYSTASVGMKRYSGSNSYKNKPRHAMKLPTMKKRVFFEILVSKKNGFVVIIPISLSPTLGLQCLVTEGTCLSTVNAEPV